MDNGQSAGGRSLDFAIAANAMAGEIQSGDRHLVCNLPHGALLAVIDGLGHGPNAAEAAVNASRIFELNAQQPIEQLVRVCHESLKQTRGVAATLASVDFRKDTLTWLGVGNVEGRLMRASRVAQRPSEWVLLRGGIVGHRLPSVQSTTLPFEPNDLLIMATDGISSNFGENIDILAAPQLIADKVMREHRKHDDALVLVARYLRDEN